MTKALIQHLPSGCPGRDAGGLDGRALRDRDGQIAFAPGRRAGRGASALRGLVARTLALLVALAFCLCAHPAPEARASAQGDLIVNHASLQVEGVPLISSSVAVSVVLRTNSTVEFLKYAAPLPDGSLIPGATLVTLDTTYYRTGSSADAPFAALPAPTPLGSTTQLPLAGPVPLMPASAYHAGEPVFVRVTDPDQNLDRGTRDTIVTTVKNSSTGETELLRLTETGPDTGIFTGYLPSRDGSGSTGAGSYQGVIPVSQGNPLIAHYVDSVDGSDSSAASVIVDPLGIVFDSATGQPIDGASVTLFDVTNNRPATVFGDNGVSSFPSTVSTGSVPKDSSGRSYAFPPGGFRSPRWPPTPPWRSSPGAPSRSAPARAARVSR